MDANTVLEKLGELEADASLWERACEPEFFRADFTNGAEPPKALTRFLQANGLESAEDASLGMLFASEYGVAMHEDEQPSVLWVIGGPVSSGLQSHQLVVAGEVATLELNDVYYFDATKPHGLIASAQGLWAVFSMYVRPIEAKNAKTKKTRRT